MPDVVILFQRLPQSVDLVLDWLGVGGGDARTDLVVNIVGTIAATISRWRACCSTRASGG